MAIRAPRAVEAFIEAHASKFTRPDYTEYDEHGNQTAVYCRDCGTKIKGWVDVSNEPDGKIRQRFLQLGNYKERAVELTDGSLMNIVMCAECPAPVAADFDAHWAVELMAWTRSIQRVNPSQEFMERYMRMMFPKRIARVVE